MEVDKLAYLDLHGWNLLGHMLGHILGHILGHTLGHMGTHENRNWQ